MIVTRPGKAKAKQKEEDLQKDKWYTNIVEAHLAINQSSQRPQTTVQAVYDLDTDKSVTTIHNYKNKQHTNTCITNQSKRDGDSSGDDEGSDSQF